MAKVNMHAKEPTTSSFPTAKLSNRKEKNRLETNGQNSDPRKVHNEKRVSFGVVRRGICHSGVWL